MFRCRLDHTQAEAVNACGDSRTPGVMSRVIIDNRSLRTCEEIGWQASGCHGQAGRPVLHRSLTVAALIANRSPGVASYRVSVRDICRHPQLPAFCKAHWMF